MAVQLDDDDVLTPVQADGLWGKLALPKITYLRTSAAYALYLRDTLN